MTEMRDWLFGTEGIAWIQELFGLGHPLPFRILSLLGDTWGILLVIGLALWLFGRRAAYAVVGIVIAGAATKLLLTDIFYQTRPEGAGIVVYEHLEIGSFPSGHVYQAVGPWGLLAALGYLPLWAAALLGVLVGLGRLYLGTHYIGDVLGGLVFGAMLVWIYFRGWPRLENWLRERGRAFYATVAVVVICAAFAWMLRETGHPRPYEIFGMALAAGVALPLEHRFLRYVPADDSWPIRLMKALIGIAVIAGFVLWSRVPDEQPLLVGALAAGLATFWTILGAPGLFSLLGLGRRAREGAQTPGGEPTLPHLR